MKVLRAGDEIVVGIEQIFVGDVVILETGDNVPADGLFLNGHCIFYDLKALQTISP